MTTTRIGGYEVELLAAGEVEIDWRLLVGGEPVTVREIRFFPPRGDEVERQMKIWLHGEQTPLAGDEGQTVYRIVGEPAQAS